MSTRSFIGYVENNSIKGIYCHFDGYISHNGKILQEHYNNIDVIKKLIDLGHISALGVLIEPTEKHTFEQPQDNVTIAYHRDRGEDKEIDFFNTYKGFVNYIKKSWYDYVYIFFHNQWYVLCDIEDNSCKMKLLTDCIKDEKHAKLIDIILFEN